MAEAILNLLTLSVFFEKKEDNNTNQKTKRQIGPS